MIKLVTAPPRMVAVAVAEVPLLPVIETDVVPAE